mmetsp:Transcript_9501/g.17316  ORF Transcript_9501/g.17316 Transcript_9501/m.17316 type:complete len:88 (+) Transcript_9501:30-293(+)
MEEKVAEVVEQSLNFDMVLASKGKRAQAVEERSIISDFYWIIQRLKPAFPPGLKLPSTLFHPPFFPLPFFSLPEPFFSLPESFFFKW